jgi:hypothetical protein
LVVPNTTDPAQNIGIALAFRPENHGTLPGLTGTLTFGGTDYPIGPGWQHVWNAKSHSAFNGKDRTLNVVIENAEPDGPQGDGFATIKLNKAGLAKWAAVLADGNKVTGSFTASPDGDLPLYVPIRYLNGGALLALLGTESAGELLRVSGDGQPNGRWIKPPADPRKADRLYRSGFDVNLEIEGAEFVKPATGQLLFGNPAPSRPLRFDLSGGGIATASQLGGRDPVNWNAELQKANKLVVTQAGLSVKISPSFSATTGVLSGRIALSDLVSGKKLPRALTLNALYIPDLEDPAASNLRGFFLLPELPDAGGNATMTSIQSGRIDLNP